MHACSTNLKELGASQIRKKHCPRIQHWAWHCVWTQDKFSQFPESGHFIQMLFPSWSSSHCMLLTDTPVGIIWCHAIVPARQALLRKGVAIQLPSWQNLVSKAPLQTLQNGLGHVLCCHKPRVSHRNWWLLSSSKCSLYVKISPSNIVV